MNPAYQGHAFPPGYPQTAQAQGQGFPPGMSGLNPADLAALQQQGFMQQQQQLVLQQQRMAQAQAMAAAASGGMSGAPNMQAMQALQGMQGMQGMQGIQAMQMQAAAQAQMQAMQTMQGAMGPGMGSMGGMGMPGSSSSKKKKASVSLGLPIPSHVRLLPSSCCMSALRAPLTDPVGPHARATAAGPPVGASGRPARRGTLPPERHAPARPCTDRAVGGHVGRAGPTGDGHGAF